MPRSLCRRACLKLVMALACKPSHGQKTLAWRSQFDSGLADWGALKHQWGFDNHLWINDSAIAGSVLRVVIRAGSIDPASMVRRGLPRSGTGFKAELVSGGSDSATLRYRVRFPVGFNFVRGGKLPGLYGGLGNSGGRIPRGDDGFSLRLMWREQGIGEVYAYLPGSKLYGTSYLRGSFRFVPGRWHEVSQHVRLNEPGQLNGSVTMALDGRTVGVQTGLLFRQSDQLGVNGVFFDCFFGGNDDSWAAAADTHVDFAEFEVLAPAAGS